MQATMKNKQEIEDDIKKRIPPWSENMENIEYPQNIP